MIHPGFIATEGANQVLLTTAPASGFVISCDTFVGFQNLSTSAQSVTVQAFDGAESQNLPLTPAVTLAGSQLYVLPLGGVRPANAFVTVIVSGAPTTGIRALFQQPLQLMGLNS